MSADSFPDPPVLAAIDIGSNSFRLEIGQLIGARYRRIVYQKRVVRLGADLDEQSRLAEAGIRRGLDTLAGFAPSLKAMPAAHVRAVATQTLREATNREDFLQRAQAVLGHPIEVISGREEARLIFAGVAFLQPSPLQRLVIDIGGRSTELILGQRREPSTAESFAVGSVSLSMRHFPDGRLTAQGFRAAQAAAGAEFEEALTAFSPDRWSEALGSSGTVGAVADVLEAMSLTDGRVTLPALQHLRDRAIQAGDVRSLQLPGLKEDRRAVLPGGLAILLALLESFQIDALLPAKGALRQGVIVDLHGRLQARGGEPVADMRDQTVRALQQRYEVDAEQAARVARLALQFHDAVDRRADPEARRELAWAAALHELGLFVSHHDHHRHCAYLLANLDAPGFSQSQQGRLADLVLAQRGGLRKVDALLKHSAWAVLCLRLAVIRCHARIDPPDAPWTLQRVSDGVARLAWGSRGGAPSERTLYLLREEAEVWARHGALRLDLPRD